MKRIYVAGSYSSIDSIKFLNNIRVGIEYAAVLLTKGYAVYCPHLDHHFAFTNSPPTLDLYRDNGLAWLEVSAAVCVIPHSEKSHGTQTELHMAREWGIPVFYSIEELEKAIQP